jgi:hypothetical protein
VILEAPVPDTGALTVESTDIASDLIDPSSPGDGTSTITRDDQDSKMSTLFGGGLAAPLLYKIVHRCIERHRKNNLSSVRIHKCMPRMAVVGNTVPIYRLVRSNLESASHLPERRRSNEGYIISELDDTGDSDKLVGTNAPFTITPGSLLTHINGRSVGLMTSDDAFGDATWFLDEGDTINLTIQRFESISGQWSEYQVLHTVTQLPPGLDRHVNDPQGWDGVWVTLGWIASIFG